MSSVRAIFAIVLVAGLAVYSLDCSASATRDEAMQCCDSMPCPHHSGDASQDCCQTMPSLHAPFVQPHVVDIACHAPAILAMLPAVSAFQGVSFSANIRLAVQSHAPPLSPIISATPLRI
jgi:hypothetical protein